MTQFQGGKIYKLVSGSTDKIYIGSTCKTLESRLNSHKASYKQKGDRYYSAKELLRFPDCRIVLIEAYPCNDQIALRRREGHYISLLKEHSNTVVNKSVAGRTSKEWKTQNKEHVSAVSRRRYQRNKERILASRKEYYQQNKERIKARALQYYYNKKTENNSE